MRIPSRHENDKVWQTYARSYDQILPVLPFYQEVVTRHVSALTKSGIRNVIDVGAGTGNVAIKLAAKGLQVTAVDTCAEMLDRLHRKQRPGLSGTIQIIEQDAESLRAWANEAFDGATVLLTLFAMRHPRLALQEIMRVLRHGGIFVVTETKKNFQLQPLLDYVERFFAEQTNRDCLREDWERVRKANITIDPGQRHERLTVEEIEQSLRDSGFKITEVKDSHLGQCATIWAKKLACVK